MTDLPRSLVLEVQHTLEDLRGARLASAAWPAVVGDLGRLAAAVERGDADAVPAALLPLSRATFEGKVRGRLAAADRPAAMVVGTKPTSALPAVGAFSAALLIGIGYLLGGWAVAAITSVFALFVFGVALAGTRTTNDRLALRRRTGLGPSLESSGPAPDVVGEAIGRIEAELL